MATEGDKDWASIVTPESLCDIAGERFFERGEDYFYDGAVRSLRASGSGVEAMVQGTRRYRVRLWIEQSTLCSSCNCPVGRDGLFCKHCVAVGLAWHDRGANLEGTADIGDHPASSQVDLQSYLSGLEKQALVSLILERADEDPRFMRKLVLGAAQAGAQPPDLSVWKQAFDETLQTDDFVDYRGAFDYASDIEEVVGSLAEMLKAGQAESVISLAEYGLDEIEEAIQYIDDSDGWLGGLMDQLQKLHLEACRAARPDPVDLAERLFEAETSSGYGAFHNAVVAYADVLGKEGLAAYRRLAEADWAKVPALGPGEQEHNRHGERFRITSIMETLAELAADFGALIAIKSHDLSSPYAYLEIAELYQDRGDAEKALEWAEQGWQAFAHKRPDERLRSFIADAYQARGRHEDAMELVWQAFSDQPWLDNYRQLRQHGERAGAWPAWRNKALTLIRERIADPSDSLASQRFWDRQFLRDHSALVEIFLDEDDSETAWREAKAGGCSDDLWLALAKARERGAPHDAVRIYQSHVAKLLRNTGDRVYQEALHYLDKISALLGQSDGSTGFRSYLTEIRATHKRKRKLMQMLDQHGW